MIENPYVHQALFFGLNFALILSQLIVYSIFAWVIANWLIMFGIINPNNRFFTFLTQLIIPLVRPFAWARIGMIDFAPLVVIMLFLYLILPSLQGALQELVG